MSGEVKFTVTGTPPPHLPKKKRSVASHWEAVRGLAPGESLVLEGDRTRLSNIQSAAPTFGSRNSMKLTTYFSGDQLVIKRES